jgi:hypothetical protein
MAVLGRAEIIRAIRIRKLLDQAASEQGPASAAFLAKARELAMSYPQGKLIVYNGRRAGDW